MFTFSFQNEQLQTMLSDRTTFWDAQVEEELTPVLKQLKEHGEITGATCGQKPGIAGLALFHHSRQRIMSLKLSTP